MQIGILKAIGLLVFLYLTWRNSRDNYGDEKMISYSWLSLGAFLFGGRLIYGLLNWGVWNDSIISWFLFWQKPGLSYTGAYLSWVLVSALFAQKNEWKVWSFMEESIGNFWIFLVFVMLDEIFRSGFNTLVIFVLAVLIIVGILSLIIGKKYRSFVWYKSGKKGFLFFFVNILFWLILGVRALIFKDGVIVGSLYVILSLISLTGLVMLGEVFNQQTLLFAGRRRKNER